LEVDYLNGEPGVYSARYAGDHCSFEDNNTKLLKALNGVSHRSARFKTMICLILDDQEFYFEGVCEGRILESYAGKEGFGYDPLFLPKGFNESFAQMSMNQKNEISHRGLAVKKLIEFLNRL
jgi:XTP/dITP diphosphohydrolase